MPRRPMAKRSTAADGSTTVRGKRGNGAGSIYFDQANECYFATWRDADGKRRKVRGKTQAEAERRRDEAIDKHAATAPTACVPVHGGDDRARARRVVARQRGAASDAPVVGRHRRQAPHP